MITPGLNMLYKALRDTVINSFVLIKTLIIENLNTEKLEISQSETWADSVRRKKKGLPAVNNKKDIKVNPLIKSLVKKVASDK